MKNFNLGSSCGRIESATRLAAALPPSEDRLRDDVRVCPLLRRGQCAAVFANATSVRMIRSGEEKSAEFEGLSSVESRDRLAPTRDILGN